METDFPEIGSLLVVKSPALKTYKILNNCVTLDTSYKSSINVGDILIFLGNYLLTGTGSYHFVKVIHNEKVVNILMCTSVFPKNLCSIRHFNSVFEVV